MRKPLHFIGSSLEDLRAFPDEARPRRRVQSEFRAARPGAIGLEIHEDRGAGVNELRVRDRRGVFRVIYLATRPEAVYVLHCFQKKTRKTRKADLELAARRLRQIGDE